jgi:D-lactate dehydrogenase (cytochrome)
MAFAHVPGTVDPFAERHGWYVLIELSGMRDDGSLRAGLEETLAQAVEDGLVADAVIAESLEQARALWYLREALPEAQKFEGGSIKHDVAVPVSRVAEFIVEGMKAVEAAIPGIRPVPFGHVGDGNIHFNLTQPKGADTAAFMAEYPRMNRLVHDMVEAMGGTFSAEHGIGRLKIEEMARYRSAVELDLMRAVKATLDPKGIMNPGKVI